ncbi:MAG: hypothetical protein IPL31_00100 [Saprospiraceae bacterium]|nr:hypothetical protein [Saprospiraceae bacterium]
MNLIPYSEIKDKDFPIKSILNINANQFNRVNFIPGLATITFSGCRFTQVIITNFENIEFPDISLSFDHCYIEKLEVKDIHSQNIALLFGSTILSGNVESANLKNISFNNCILYQNIFLLNRKNIHITYTEENIFFFKWKKLLESISVKNYREILETTQAYYIHDSKCINYNTNENKTGKVGIYRRKYAMTRKKEIICGYYLTEKEKNLLNISLSIKFSQMLIMLMLK